MNTIACDLNIFHALKKSLSFCLEFVKTNLAVSCLMFAFFLCNSLYSKWVVFTLQSEGILAKVLDPLALLPTFFAPRFALPYILLIIACSVVAYLVTYYAVRMAIAQLSPSVALADKSLLKSIWQLVCMHIVIGLVAILLYLLLILPGIWWSIKMSVASANLLSTDDGPIESIKKSFLLTEGKFWSALGYLIGTIAIPAVAIGVITTVMTLSITLPAALSLNTQQSQNWSLLFMQGLVHSIGIFAPMLIAYFCQAWLYVYLKSQKELA